MYGAPKWTTVPEQEAMRKYMGYTLNFSRKMNLARMTPKNELASTTYCLADPGMEYLVYQPLSERAFTVELPEGNYDYEWFNPAKGNAAAKGAIKATVAKHSFTPPFPGEAVLYLTKTRLKPDDR